MSSNSKIFYGDTSFVTPVGNFDYNEFSKATKREQNMPGFDSQYRDFVDYIMKITHNIWEEKGIGVIYDTYHNNVVMHSATNKISGIKEVISGTMQTLHGFPDRRLIGQNVIWSELGDGYLSSHRIMSTATNLGDSSFGKATGKKVTFRTVVDCACSNNRVYEEWLVRDNLWICKQLGYDPIELAKIQAENSVSFEEPPKSSYGINEAMEGQFSPKVYNAADESVGEVMLEMVSRIYNYKLFNEVKKYYYDNAVVHFICDKDLVGYQEIQGMLISIFASMPNASYEAERVTINKRANTENSYDVAIRYRIRGINEGIGYFGNPSGKPIEILGINHYYVVDNRVQEEWMTFDGLDVLKQMYK
ncbi:ester cyclase [Brachyspira pilosicoli]|uniref:ester cyclase n=1 Tax=Brachyspira pilosicoli TaxID=52584 RepID=UPI001C6666A8|nr:ester cyclase [Brachyspira pilosicoli]MBW5396816.1 polyketide cyclase [Brachyspira pilosicoli]